MEIFSEGILLRPWAISDASNLAIVANNKKIAENVRDGFPFPYSVRDAHDWLNIILPENYPPDFLPLSLTDSWLAVSG